MRHECVSSSPAALDRQMGVSGLARAARDDALRGAAAQFCPGMSDRAAAAFLRTRLLRLRMGSFRRDRFCESPPNRLEGRLEARLWAALMAVDAVPSERTIRRVLSP
jgi:hypothetical protein